MPISLQPLGWVGRAGSRWTPNNSPGVAEAGGLPASSSEAERAGGRPESLKNPIGHLSDKINGILNAEMTSVIRNKSAG